ncbi:MAG: GatB/YqeY domain-containing protein [Roseinatronobacter sp.]
MSLRDKIAAELKTAMKARDTHRLATLRLINAAIKDREIAARGDQGVSELSDADLSAVLARMVKQRRDSARAYEEAARLDLAEKELAEITVIEDFLPRQLSDPEMAEAIAAIIAETKATTVRDIGKVMAALKTRHAGQMDFGKAGTIVKERLAR